MHNQELCILALPTLDINDPIASGSTAEQAQLMAALIRPSTPPPTHTQIPIYTTEVSLIELVYKAQRNELPTDLMSTTGHPADQE